MGCRGVLTAMLLTALIVCAKSVGTPLTSFVPSVAKLMSSLKWARSTPSTSSSHLLTSALWASAEASCFLEPPPGAAVAPMLQCPSVEGYIGDGR